MGAKPFLAFVRAAAEPQISGPERVGAGKVDINIIANLRAPAGFRGRFAAEKVVYANTLLDKMLQDVPAQNETNTVWGVIWFEPLLELINRGVVSKGIQDRNNSLVEFHHP